MTLFVTQHQLLEKVEQKSTFQLLENQLLEKSTFQLLEKV